MEKADFVRNRETIRHLIEKVHMPEKLSVAQHNAISTACMLMQKQHADDVPEGCVHVTVPRLRDGVGYETR